MIKFPEFLGLLVISLLKYARNIVIPVLFFLSIRKHHEQRSSKKMTFGAACLEKRFAAPHYFNVQAEWDCVEFHHQFLESAHFKNDT